MNAIKNYATIHLQLNQIDGLEVAILLYDLSIKVCVPNKTKDLNISIFNMITGVNESKIKKKKKNIYHANVNVNLIEENVIQIKS